MTTEGLRRWTAALAMATAATVTASCVPPGAPDPSATTTTTTSTPTVQPPGSTTTGTKAIGARSEVVNCQNMRRSGATPERTNATVSPGRMVVWEAEICGGGADAREVGDVGELQAPLIPARQSHARTGYRAASSAL